MPKTCPRCGTSCGDGQTTCPRCGSRLPMAQRPQQPPPYGQRPQQPPHYGQRPPQQPYGHQPYGPQGAGGVTVAPSLLTGLKRLFTSTVLQLVGVGLIVLGLIVMVAAGAGAITSSSYSQLRGATGGAIFGIILVVIAAIVVLIGYIFNIVGVITVSKENEKLKIAFFALLAYLVLFVISLIITLSNLDEIGYASMLGVSSRSASVSSVLSTLSNVAYAVMFVFLCNGIKDVGAKFGFLDFLGSSNGIVIAYLIYVGLNFIVSFIPAPASLVMSFIGLICYIVSFFLYMGYLRKAIRGVTGASTSHQQYR